MSLKRLGFSFRFKLLKKIYLFSKPRSKSCESLKKKKNVKCNMLITIILLNVYVKYVFDRIKL